MKDLKLECLFKKYMLPKNDIHWMLRLVEKKIITKRKAITMAENFYDNRYNNISKPICDRLFK